ncbi:MAG: ABC transporter ATP-binding protein [Rhodoglobus sp.]
MNARESTAALATLDHVTRRFGTVTAVDDVSLTIQPGTILGLLGPNGAGKTTIISLLQGLRKASSGTVTLFGGDPSDARNRVRLGSTPQETALPDSLKVGEVITFVGSHFPDRRPAAELAEEFGLTDLLRRQIGSLSGGQKRRVSVALAFAGNPSLVLLDEPTTGLDVDARHTLWQAIRAQHDRGATVVLTSHYLEEIEALAERVVVMARGQVVADDSLAGILSQVGGKLVTLRSPQFDKVAELAGVLRAEGDTLLVADSDAFLARLVNSGLEFSDLTVRGASLEEAFLSLTETPALSAELEV